MRKTGLYAAYNVGKINGGCATDWVFPDMRWCLREYVSRYVYNSKSLNNEELGITGYSIETYPNPANKNISILLNIPNEDIVTCSIYDFYGKLISNIINNEKLISGKYTYNIDKFPQGIYLIKLTSQSGSSTEEKVFFY